LDRQGFCEFFELDIDGFENEEVDEKSADVVADMAFYFLRDVFHTHKHHHRWEERLIHAYPVQDGSEELYDHEADPNEWRNLTDNPKLAKTKKRLAKWLPNTNAPNAKQRKR